MFRLFAVLMFTLATLFAASADAGLLLHRHKGGCANGQCGVQACAPATTAPMPVIPAAPAACSAPQACAPAACAPAARGEESTRKGWHPFKRLRTWWRGE